MNSPLDFTSLLSFGRRSLTSLFAIALLGFSSSLPVASLHAQDAATAADDEDADFETLYFKANDLMRAQKWPEAAATMLKAIESTGDFGWEDYGKAFGGVYFDYGTCLLQLADYPSAAAAFKSCSQSDELAKDTKIPGENKRKNIAIFGLGFCEDKLGNPDEALKLYAQYEALPPDPAEFELVRSALALRKGSANLHVGNVTDGTTEIQKIFDNKDEWKVGPQFLMQGLLELGLGWVESAVKDPSKADGLEKSAHLFLDKYQG